MSRFPEKINIKLDNPIYRGSVQNLYDVPGHPDLIISETTAGGSVFDVGTIFEIEGSDLGRAGFRHLVFQELQDPEAWKTVSASVKDETGLLEKMLASFKEHGALTHHAGMVERETGKVFSKGFPSELSNLTLINKYTAERPDLKKVMGWHFYDYKKYHSKDRYVIPLEYIVRLGITSGSSILKKFSALSDSDKKTYLNELGLDKPLTPWTRFDRPLVDLTTKYEPEDRNISRQEASLISGLDGDTFSQSLIMAVLGALLLQQIFSKMGLNLWDLKWEIAKDGDDLIFVDTIDTDSVRVTFNLQRDNKTYFVHFNKQAMRDYYRIMHPDWISAVNECKKLAAHSGRPFTEILSAGQKSGPYPANPAIDKAFLNIQKAKFEMIQRFIKDQSLNLSNEAEKIAVSEIEYYASFGKLDEYEKLNAV
ncbi:MAG: phosphoribosylaminoimidazolesuccinocarboxamide synthase [Thermodesulfovibrionia bacterium]|nr:phosphoribosylaminoimidazolesuccinocarboxamide synthase [Thermodesulfovibrionia bacterium]